MFICGKERELIFVPREPGIERRQSSPKKRIFKGATAHWAASVFHAYPATYNIPVGLLVIIRAHWHLIVAPLRMLIYAQTLCMFKIYL